LEAQTGFQITFESALVPRWREGTLRLQNVNILCNAESYRDFLRDQARQKGLPLPTDEEINTNWTYWDIQIRSVDVTLSLWRWLDGKGFIKECTMKGVRGNLDRRHITWNSDWVPLRRSPQFGDFELTKFIVEDFLITVQNPNFRLYSISIFHATLPILRKQWLLYDFFCADSIVGVFDDCLFSVHKPQRDDLVLDEESKGPWAKMVSFFGIVPTGLFNPHLA
jgi:distribution and morphology protein 31